MFIILKNMFLDLFLLGSVHINLFRSRGLQLASASDFPMIFKLEYTLPFVETETSAQMKQEMKGEEENQAGTWYFVICVKKVIFSLQ